MSLLCAPFLDCIATTCPDVSGPALPFAFPFWCTAPQWGFVFTLMTLELGLVLLPLYARNR